jgi:hypothetical protein
MSKSNQSGLFFCGPVTYEICLRGHLQDRWKESFEFMSLTRKNDGTSLLTGKLPDQSALHSVLMRIRDMNIELISVRQVKDE